MQLLFLWLLFIVDGRLFRISAVYATGYRGRCKLLLQRIIRNAYQRLASK